MRLVHSAALLSVALALPVLAKLPAPSDEAKATAAESAAKAAWADKVGAYQLCMSQDRVVNGYLKSGKAAASGAAPAPVATTACTDPGPYVATTPAASKPIEAAGAHSPPGTATSPPSTTAPAAQVQPKK